MSNNNFGKIQNSILNNNQMATSKVVESGIFLISTTTQGTLLGQSAYESKDIVVRWTKCVDEVTLVFENDSILRTVVANNVTYTGVPVNLRPIDQQVFTVILGSNNSTGCYIVVAIETGGTIVMGVGGANPSTGNPFTAGNLVTGPYPFSITYYTGIPLPE